MIPCLFKLAHMNIHENVTIFHLFVINRPDNVVADRGEWLLALMLRVISKKYWGGLKSRSNRIEPIR